MDHVAGPGATRDQDVLKMAGHHLGGLAKIRAATDIAKHMDVDNNRSASFRAFADAIRSMVGSQAQQEKMEH